MPQIHLSVQGYATDLGGTPFTVSFEATDVTGKGGFYSPHLRIPLTFRAASARPDEERIVADLMSELHLGPLSLEGPGSPSPDCLIGRGVFPARLPGAQEFTIIIYVPTSAAMLEHIEDVRAGNDLELSLYLRVGLVVRVSSQRRLSDLDAVFGATTFRIPRSHWVDHVLPALGHLSRYILEVPAPSTIELVQPFERAAHELRNAEDDFRRDNYDGCLTNCRNAIDAVASAIRLDLGGEPASFANRVRAFQKEQLQGRIGGTKSELVVQELLALWPALSAATKPGPFTADRPAAKHVLIATANLLGYLGRAFQDS